MTGMTAKEAHVKLIEKYPELRAISCYEYDSLFAFQTVPKNYKGDTRIPLFNGAMAVVKATGKVRDIKPFNIPLAEYKNGKEVTDFE